MMRLAVVSFAFLLSILIAACQTGPDLSKITPTPTPDPGASPSEQEISDSYEIKGSNENSGAQYNGALLISNQGPTYRFDWQTTRGKYSGVGVQMADTVAVTFSRYGKPEGCGVALYRIDDGNTLTGRIVRWGEESIETQTGKQTKGSNFDGTYEVSGNTADGRKYSGPVEVVKNGRGYQFLWNTFERRVGFGIWQGDHAAISFGGQNCWFAVYRIKGNGDLEGRTGGQFSVEFGFEDADRQ